MALALLDSTLSTPKLLKCSSVMVPLKAVLINYSIEKLCSQDAVLMGSASTILHSLNIWWKTSLNGSRTTVSSINAFGVS